jgi:hypothetical protein
MQFSRQFIEDSIDGTISDYILGLLSTAVQNVPITKPITDVRTIGKDREI